MKSTGPPEDPPAPPTISTAATSCAQSRPRDLSAYAQDNNMSSSIAEQRWSTLPPTARTEPATRKSRSLALSLPLPAARSRAALVPITLLTLFMYWTVVNPV